MKFDKKKKGQFWAWSKK